MTIKERDFLLEFFQTDPEDPSQNLYESISTNKFFTLDEKLSSLNNLKYNFQTRGQEDKKLELDVNLRLALEHFYQIQGEFLSFLRLRLKLSEKDLELSAKHFVSTLTQTLVIDESTGQILEEAIDGKVITVQRDFFSEEVYLRDFLLTESVKQVAPINVKNLNKLFVQEYDHKGTNCENFETGFGTEQKAKTDSENFKLSDHLEKTFMTFLDNKILEINKDPSITLEEAETDKFGPVEFELFEKFLLDPKKPIFRKLDATTEASLQALKLALSCPDKLTDFVAFKISKFAKIPSNISSRYSSVLFGSSKEVQNIIFFQDKNYYLDFSKIQDSKYA